MEKFTPGPWHVSEVGTEFYIDAIDAMEPPGVATVYATPGELSKAKADATLIAAAPELVEALKEARSGLFAYAGGIDGYCGDTIARIDAALSKAGVSP